MASGWWQSTHDNLAEVSPVDFAVTTGPDAPRGYPKVASIATGAGLFLGGTPCVEMGDIIYYAGDTYTQDTDEPILLRYDGRVCTTVLQVSDVGVTPSKAILSLAADGSNIYISTWDSGTSNTTFTGRLLKFNPETGVVTELGAGLFTAGRLPYALTYLSPNIYVGVSNQNPATPTPIYIINTSTGVVSVAQDNSTTTTYEVTAIQAGSGTESGPSSAVSVTCPATLSADAFNTLTWTAPVMTAASPTVTPTIISQTAVGGQFRNNIGPYYFRYSYSTATSAGSSSELTAPSAFSTGMTPIVDFRAIDVTVPHSTDPAVKWIHFHFNNTGSGATAMYANTAGGGVVANNVSGGTAAFTITLNDTSNLVSPYPTTNSSIGSASSYRVYRTAGHSSQGRIGTPTATTFIDDGDAGGGQTAPAPNSVAAPTGLAVAKRNTKLFVGASGTICGFDGNVYAGLYQATGTFASVQKITPAGIVTTSNTIAPGGTAGSYNGFTASIVFEDNLYMAYWNDDTTDITLIRKCTSAGSWSTVATISGAGARPMVGFAEADGSLWAYGGGDGVTGILYSSVDGTTWVNQSALLPSSKEAIPFIANTNVLGGF